MEPLEIRRLQAQLKDQDPGVRREAAEALGRLEYYPAINQLSQLVTNDPDADVRCAATSALGFTRDSTLLAILQQALDDTHWKVREKAAATLGRLGFDEAGPDLMISLDDESWQVRLQAVQALGQLRFTPASSALSELLSYSIAALRKEAALALGELGDYSAFHALKKAEADPDPEVRQAIRSALIQLAGRIA